MKTFKILGLFLSYPTEELVEHMDDLVEVMAQEKILPSRSLKKVKAFASDLQTKDIYDLQEDYVELFDRGRTHCLQLFEHIHGESRDRGQAMVDLSDHYISHGVTLSANELPDYLPLFLEFLSQIDFEEAQELLGETVHIVAGVGAKLKAKKQGYHQVFRAIEALTTVKVDEKFLEQAVSEAEAEDTSNEALDKEWEDAPAFDGTGEADCNSCPSATRHPLTSPQAGTAPAVNQ